MKTIILFILFLFVSKIGAYSSKDFEEDSLVRTKRQGAGRNAGRMLREFWHKRKQNKRTQGKGLGRKGRGLPRPKSPRVPKFPTPHHWK
ncbi:unnamed protein product, partial [Mesorhabditis belari]|uniref:Uncharacterized protein n=1 Tax=Mesorhabditis belari TaxID=2138241 RepID=A0AAF3FQE8_9BILA